MTTVDSDSLAAGRSAFERHEWGEAFRLLSAADADGGLGGTDLERMAEAAAWSRRFEEMLRLLERAEACYRAAGDRRGAARMALKLSREYFYRRNDALMGGWLARAQTLLEGEEESREAGMLLWMLIHGALMLGGDADESIRLSEQLVELGRRQSAVDLEALGLLELGHWLIISGRVQEGSRRLDEANALASSETVDLEVAGTVYCATIFACRNIGDWSRAAAWTDRSLEWCERNSVSGFPGLCRLHRAEVIRFRGSLAEAERDARSACEELLAASPRMAGLAFHELGEVLRRRGELDAARGAFARALDLGFDPQPGFALLRLEEGDPVGALSAICRRLADRDPFTHESRALLLPAQVTIALAADAPEQAAEALRELEDVAAACGSSVFAASVVQARGEVALARGRAGDAIAELRTAWREWSEAGAPYEAAEVRLLLGRAYREVGDPIAAGLELEGARDVFARLGAKAQVARAENLVASLRGGGAVRETRTFMFTDIVDSTRLLEVVGDESWTMLLSWHDRALRACFDEHQGDEVNHEGDGFFVSFGSADAALRCAQAVQRAMRQHRREHGFAPQIRIGLHTAEATSRGGDYTGLGVHAAARVGSAAGPGEIVASADTLAAADACYDVCEMRTAQLKGLSGSVELAVVDWG